MPVGRRSLGQASEHLGVIDVGVDGGEHDRVVGPFAYPPWGPRSRLSFRVAAARRAGVRHEPSQGHDENAGEPHDDGALS